MSKTIVEIIVQGKGEPSAEFADAINTALEKIYEKHSDSTPVVIPTSAQDGRQTVMIQWSVYEKKEYSNVMIQGLSSAIFQDMKGSSDLHTEDGVLRLKNQISKRIHDFCGK